MAAEPEDQGPRLEVCICTYRRPDVLGRLLDRIATCADRAAPHARVGVVVVDDDPEGSAREVVEAAQGDLALRYLATASGNVSVARNAALGAALERADLVAFIDDDCWPVEEWLSALVEVQRRTGADAVAGACTTLLPDGAPGWLSDEPFLEETTDEDDGAPARLPYVKNLLVVADALRTHDLGFDERFGLAGGEDAMFLDQMGRHGLQIVHSAEAVVAEQLPPERTTLRWQLRRRWWYGNTEAVTSIESGSASRPRVVARGLRSTARAVTRPVVRVAGGQPPQLRFAVAEVLRGLGRALGGLGVWLRHH